LVRAYIRCLLVLLQVQLPLLVLVQNCKRAQQVESRETGQRLM
jgi:hypothetical protein